jgi:hypothetical protein
VLVPAAAETLSSQNTMRASRPMREIDADDAYALAIEQDTLPLYVEFVENFPTHPYAARIWAIIRARREALAWMRALDLNTPAAYWTYLNRYPAGVYAADGQQRLRRLSAQPAPPVGFTPVAFFDVPAPLPNEPTELAEFLPDAPPPPRILIEPPSPIFASLPAPQQRPGILPEPAPLPVIANVTPGMRRPIGVTAARTPPSVPGTAATGLPPAPARTAPAIANVPAGMRQRLLLPGSAAGSGRPGLAAPGATRPAIAGPGAARPAITSAAVPTGTPPQAVHRPPPDIRVGAPTDAIAIPPSPPKVVNRPPPAIGAVPPKPAAARVLPLPPPTGVTPTPAVARAVSPPPPARPRATPALGPAPPPAVARVQPAATQRPAAPRPPKPTAQEAQKLPVEKKCVVVDGKQVCI